jgi:hypothetical protein
MATNAEIEYCYHSLAIAIVKQAVTDYRNVVNGKCESGTCPEAVIKEVTKFLKSQWFEDITRVKGKYILKVLKDEQAKGELYEGQLTQTE